MPYEPSGRNVREDFYVGSMQAALARSLAAGVDFDDIVAAASGGGGGSGLSADYEAALGKYDLTGQGNGPTLYDPASAAWDDAGSVGITWDPTFVQWSWYYGAGDNYVSLQAGASHAGFLVGAGSGSVEIRTQPDSAYVEMYMAAAQTASPFVITGAFCVTAAGALGVGNSADGATPGTCVKKIEVFAADGTTSLGFLAVYDAIAA